MTIRKPRNLKHFPAMKIRGGKRRARAASRGWTLRDLERLHGGFTAYRDISYETRTPSPQFPQLPHPILHGTTPAAIQALQDNLEAFNPMIRQVREAMAAMIDHRGDLAQGTHEPTPPQEDPESAVLRAIAELEAEEAAGDEISGRVAAQLRGGPRGR